MILKSVMSMSVVNIAKGLVSLGISLALVTQVSPSEYGLIGFSLPFVAFITLLTDLGLSSLLVRERQLSRDEIGAIYGLMLLNGLVLSGLLAALSPLIEHLTAMAGLAQVLQSFAVVTVCAVWSVVPRGLLERNLRYTEIAGVELAALFGGVVSFFIVLMIGGKIYSLIAYHVILNLLRLLLFLRLSRKQFSLNLHFSCISHLFKDGSLIMGSSLLSFLARNLDNIVIGFVLGAGAVGLYAFAYQLMTLPFILISWPASGVLLAALSKEDRQEDRSKILLSAVGLTACVTFPMMAYLFFGLAFPVDHFYAQRWAALPQILAWLAPVGAIQSIAIYNGPVIIRARKVQLNFILSACSGLGLSLVFLLSVSFGLMVLVQTYALAATLMSLVLLHYLCTNGGISHGELGRALIPGGVASCLALFVVFACGLVHPQNLASWMAMTGIFAAVVPICLFGFRSQLLAAARNISTFKIVQTAGA